MTDDRARDRESGRYEREYSDEEFVRAVRENAPVGTGDVAEYVGCHHKLAYKRLTRLEDEGVVESQKVGRSLIWSLRESGD